MSIKGAIGGTAKFLSEVANKAGSKLSAILLPW